MRDSRPELHSTLIQGLQQPLRRKATFLFELNQYIYTILPYSKNICRVANWRQGVLVLECASSAWRMKLNCDRHYLLSTLRNQRFSSLINIEIKINPDLAQAEIEHYRPKTPPAARGISKQSAESLANLASSCSTKIAARLNNIAALAKKKSP